MNMSGLVPLPSTLNLLLKQTIYHCRLFIRMPRGIFSAFLAPTLVLLALRYLMPGNGHLSASSLYLIIGPVTMGIVMTAYDSHASGLLAARTSGVLKRLHGTPLPSWCYFVGRIIATIVISVASSIAVLLVARGLYDFHLTAAMILTASLTVAVGALAWAAVGTAVTRFIKDAGSGQTVLAAVYLPLLFLSGTFSSFASEPSWMQTLAKCFPAQPIADGLGRILSNTSFDLMSLASYGVLAAWALVGTFVAAKTFRWE